jgi:hypothetical protein
MGHIIGQCLVWEFELLTTAALVDLGTYSSTLFSTNSLLEPLWWFIIMCSYSLLNGLGIRKVFIFMTVLYGASTAVSGLGL